MARGNAVAQFGNETPFLVTVSTLLSSTNSTSLAKWLLGLAKKELKSLNSNRQKTKQQMSSGNENTHCAGYLPLACFGVTRRAGS